MLRKSRREREDLAIPGILNVHCTQWNSPKSILRHSSEFFLDYQIDIAGEDSTQDTHIQWLDVPLFYNLLLLPLNISQKYALVNQEFC